jgi:pimeloyl-ACP methyl ester carboxylesterase
LDSWEATGLVRRFPWSFVDCLSIASGALVDSLVLAIMKGPWAHPTLADIERLAAEVKASHLLYRSLGWLERPDEFHCAPPPLTELEIVRGWPWPIAHEWLSFASGYEPHRGDPAAGRWRSYESNHVAHAWMLRGDEDAPWLVCLHGSGTGHPFFDAAGFAARRLHETLGLNLLFPVQPLHGPRRAPQTGTSAFLSFELLDTVHGFAQAVWDARRLVRWLRDQGAKRVGIYGISLGGYTAALLATLEPVDFVLAGIPLCDIPDLYIGHTPARMRDQAEALGLLGVELRELFTLVSPLARPPTAPREHRFLFAALADRIVPPIHAQRLWEHWERPPISWYPGGHVSFFWTPGVQRFVEEALYRSGFSRVARPRLA